MLLRLSVMIVHWRCSYHDKCMKDANLLLLISRCFYHAVVKMLAHDPHGSQIDQTSYYNSRICMVESTR